MSEEPDKMTQEQMRKAGEFVSSILCINSKVRQCGAAILAGSAVMNLASARLDEALDVMDLKGLDKAFVRAVLFETLQRDSLSMSAATVKTLLHRDVEQLVNEWAAPKKTESGVFKLETSIPAIDSVVMPGGLAPGKVLVLQGTEEATDALMGFLMDRANRAGVEVKHLCTEPRIGRDVATQPLSWWGGALVDWHKEKDVFSSPALGKRALVCIDDLAQLGAGSGEEKPERFYKTLVDKLRRAARRVKLPVVVRWICAEDSGLELKSRTGAYAIVRVTLRDDVLAVDGERVERNG